jgi:hypothetical protein
VATDAVGGSFAPGPSVIFVGRQAELCQVEASFERVRVGVVHGLPGIGKSGLAYAIGARRRGALVYGRFSAAEPTASVIDDVRRQLSGGAVGSVLYEHERLRDLHRLLDANDALWIVDDLHRLGVEAARDLLATLARSLQRGCVLATSREMIPLQPGGPEWFSLHLGGLDVDAARSLWSSLDGLYGPAAAEFEAAWERTRGSPFLLRQAHVGWFDDPDPIVAVVRELEPDERTVACAIALAEIRLPVAVVEQLLPDRRGARAFRRLVTRMMIDMDGRRRCALHDLFRSAVVAELRDDERHALHTLLSRLLLRADGIELVERFRERRRHLQATGDWPELGRYALENAAALIREGAADELLRALEALPAEHCTPLVSAARARTLARRLELRRAHGELERLVASRVEPHIDLRLAFAQVAMLTANLGAAEAALRSVLQEPSLPAALAMRAQFTFAAVRTYQGHGDEARAFLASAAEGVADPFHQGYLSLGHALSLFVDDRGAEFAEPMHRVQEFFGAAPAAFRTSALAPAFFTTLLARLGHWEEAKDAFAASEAALRNGGDLRMRLELRFVWALALFEHGERLQALDELRAVVDLFERSGYRLGALLGRMWIGRVQLALGHRQQAFVLIETVAAEATSDGAHAIAAAAGRSLEEDPCQRIAKPCQIDRDQTGERATRLRALAALQHAAAGDEVEARRWLESEAQSLDGIGFAVERAIGELAWSVLYRLRGDRSAASTRSARAAAIVTEAGADPELIPLLSAQVGRLRLITPDTRRLAQQLPADRFDIVLDGRTHELRARETCLSLRRTEVLRRMLYALAENVGAPIDNEALAQRIWSSTYRPQVHDNVIRVGIRRLRERLVGSDLHLESLAAGYQLVVAPSRQFVYVDPVTEGADNR